MTLDGFRDVSNRAIEPAVAVAIRLGLGANAISLLAFGLAVLAGVALVVAGDDPRWYVVGGLLVFGNGVLDVLDGAVARETATASEAGDFLDHVLDRYADALVVGGLALGVGRPGLGLLAVTGVLLTAYLGTQAQAVGVGRIYGGLLGRADILTLVGVVSLTAPWVDASGYGLDSVGWLVVALAVLSHFTALQRCVWTWRALT